MLFYRREFGHRARRPVSPDCIRHHPVLPNRVFSRRAQVGRLCGDFRYRFCAVLVSAEVRCLFRLFRGPGLRIQKSRSWRTRLSPARRIHDGRFAGVRYCCGVKPSASNCRDHSAGASRSRAMLTPRGRRPSTAARTSLGARKASEIVMLT